jgi:hypothetical protein
MSHIQPVGSFGFNNPFQGVGSAPNSSTSNGVNAGAGTTTITEESLTISVEINSSGGPTTSSSPNSSSGTPTSGASSQGSDLFANLLNQLQTALQDLLQAFGGQTAGASNTAGGVGTNGTNGTSDTGTTGTGTTSTGTTGTGTADAGTTGPSVADTGTTGAGTSGTVTTSTGSTSGSSSTNTTGGTNPTGSDSNTPATSGTTSDITIATITFDSIEITTGGTPSGTPAGTPAGTTTGTNSNPTGNTNSSTNTLQLFEQVISVVGSVFQQNGIGSSQTSSASESPLASFLGQNGLTPHQFSHGLYRSLQENGGTGFNFAHIFRNASSGQNFNSFA